MAAANRRYLIAPIENIAGSQLPSKEEVLGLLMYQIEVKKKSVREAASDVTKTVIDLWSKARIPFQRKDTILAKIEKLHNEFGNVKRNKGRAGSQAMREEAFKKDTKNLFDVATANALDTLTNEEDKAFLLAQCEPGRRGKMGSIDTQLAAVEARTAQRREQQEQQRQRAQEEASTSMTTVELESSSASAEETAEESGDGGEAMSPKRSRRATKSVITPSVAASLDRTKMTDREAVYVLSAAAHSLVQHQPQVNPAASAETPDGCWHGAQGGSTWGLHAYCSLGREIDARSYNQRERRSTSRSGLGQWNGAAPQCPQAAERNGL